MRLVGLVGGDWGRVVGWGMGMGMGMDGGRGRLYGIYDSRMIYYSTLARGKLGLRNLYRSGEEHAWCSGFQVRNHQHFKSFFFCILGI